MTKIWCQEFTNLLTGCSKLGLMSSQLGVVEEGRGPSGRNRLLGVRLPGVLYDVPCSLCSSSLSSSASLSLPTLRLNGS